MLLVFLSSYFSLHALQSVYLVGSLPTGHWPLEFPPNKQTVTRNDVEISASPRNMAIYMIFFEQNCNNLKIAVIGRNM